MDGQGERIERGLLTIVIEEQADACLIRLIGEMDASNARDLEDELIRVGRKGCSSVVLDLASLELIDPTGLAVLLRAQRRADANNHRLTITHPTGSVHRTFEVCEIYENLSVVDRSRDLSS